MKTKLLFVLSALALAACSDVTTPTILAPPRALGNMIVNDQTPVSFVIVACNGEEVSLSGTLHFMTKITTPPTGSSIAMVTSSYTFSGFGSVTGAKYEGGAHFTDKEILNQGAATVFSIKGSVHLISQGNLPNMMWLVGNTTFTIDANGNVTHNNTTFTTPCQ